MEEAVPAKRSRGGRPAAGQGDVEARLLTAATRLFLARGYEGTSCEQVALDAGAGKASIYARYANKAALFTAVIDNLMARTDAGTPADADLAAVAMRVVQDALHPDALALLRLLVAELPRVGDGSVRADQLFWQQGVRRVAAALAPADRASAEPFVELVLAPVLMRALLGEAAPVLLAGAPERIAAAIRQLGLKG
jgi:AcrR family transcriptional regulator